MGSYKIDATYLSPHVNLASRIEAATKLYRLPILMSSSFAIELSPFAQCFLRLLDRVTVKGSALPMELYGFDVDWNNIPLSLGEDVFNQRDEFVDDRSNEPKVRERGVSLWRHVWECRLLDWTGLVSESRTCRSVLLGECVRYCF